MKNRKVKRQRVSHFQGSSFDLEKSKVESEKALQKSSIIYSFLCRQNRVSPRNFIVTKMHSYITKAFLALILYATTPEAFNLEERAIVNGYDAPKRPFYVLIVVRMGEEAFQCGATLIDTRHVLTAAHCFEFGKF